MNSFFRISVYICIGLLLFNLGISFVDSLNVFPYQQDIGIQGVNETNALSSLTGLDDPNMNNIWLAVTSISLISVVALGWALHSVVPIGLWLFGEVFWTSYIHTMNVINYGGYLPGEFVVLFTVVIIFMFIAAIIGMLTGSG